MNEKIKQINETIWKFIKFTIDIFFGIFNGIITITLLVGSFTSLILLYKLYPEIFTKLVVSLLPLFILFIQIMKALMGIMISLAIGYLIFNLVIFIINTREKSIERIRIKREKFLDDLANKLKKKLKRK